MPDYKNNVKIGNDQPISKDLSTIDVGEERSSLEIASADNGARVRGDLEVTGEMKPFKATRIISDKSLELDTLEDIYLNATGEDIFFQTGATTYAKLSKTNSQLIFYENGGASTDDYLRIRCVANGETTITTVDAAGSDADLIMDVDGDITLDSQTGVFISKRAGVEFSVANSAYAGMILGYRCKGEDATPVTYTLTTSYAVINAIAGKVSFKAPPSGNVEVEFQIHYYGGNGATVSFGLSDNSTYNAIGANYECISFDVARFDDAIVKQSFVVTGLTAGTTYEYWLGAKVSSTSGTPTLKYGGDSTNENVPLIIKVIALPDAVSDFAVFG